MSADATRLDAKFQRLLEHHAELSLALQAAPTDIESFQRLSREYAQLTPVVEAIQALRAAQSEEADLTALLQDPDMRALAEAELPALRARLPDLDMALRRLLLPRDEADERSAILEIRAGTGGQEAALFGGDLMGMYRRYAALHGWSFEPISVSESDLGGIKEAVINVQGSNVFAHLKFESGVHRVQRVPLTEAGGRIHTSAATVAVLPEAEEVDIHIEDKDLRIDVFRSSGPGGQSVNTTDSAVRITHLPTGLVVSQQDEKSQHKNKAKALKVLRARLYEREREQRDSARAAQRKGMVGSGDRSERIRTYNFPQSRVTDHRIGLTLHKLDKVIAGEALDEIIEALMTQDEAERLAAENDMGH
ncbi:MAG: peptide chain release factor 1 [Alphaproteobacteria bacterium]|nr:MAG: peptide chain release factor 1 [Alphaproteobacteria bacterium]